MKSHVISITSLLLLELFSFIAASDEFGKFAKIDLKANLTDHKLIFASVIFRHGDRNIDKTYPNDPYRDEQKHWPQGFGQLTKDGMRRQYRLGKFLRRRYNEILGETYSFKNVYIQSSDYDRTIMSAQANLAGLFTPSDEEKWIDDIKWQPIPVHTVPRNLDHIIAIEQNCPKYKYLLAKYTNNSDERQRIFTEYADLIAYWSKMSGQNITSTYDIYWLFNTLDIEREQNKRLPKWAEKAVERDGIMEYIATFDFTLYADTPELARFASGFLFKEMLEHFSQKATSTLQPDRSFWMYSGHDFSIVNALNTLGLYKEIHLPAYGASLLFELYEGDSGHYVQVFYRKSEEEYLTPMYIPQCGEMCPLNEFIELCQNFIPDGDVDSECSLSNRNRL